MWEYTTFSGGFFFVAWCFSLHYCTDPNPTFDISSSSQSILSDSDVIIKCSTDNPVGIIQIIKFVNGHQLIISEGSQKSLTYFFHPIKCKDMGTYQCVVGGRTTRNLSVPVYNCPPQPCEESDNPKSIYVQVNETFQFWFCVMLIGELYNHAKFNDTLIRTNDPFNSTNWSWNRTEIIIRNDTDNNLKFWNITVTNKQVKYEDYGLLDIKVFTTHGEKYCLDYIFHIYVPGSPECPTNLSITEPKHGMPVLSWRPGLDRGSEQTFHVFTSSDLVTWFETTVPVNESYFHLPQVVCHHPHYFRVASTNSNQEVVNERTCNNTIIWSHVTRSKNSSLQCTASHSYSHNIYIFTPICVILVLLAAILGVFLHRQRVITKRYKDRCETYPHPNSEPSQLQTAGHYVSEEGLTYVTIIHDPIKSSSLKSNKSKINTQDVEYAALDFLKTEQLKMETEQRMKRTRGILPRKKKSRHHTRHHKAKEK